MTWKREKVKTFTQHAEMTTLTCQFKSHLLLGMLLYIEDIIWTTIISFSSSDNAGNLGEVK